MAIRLLFALALLLFLVGCGFVVFGPVGIDTDIRAFGLFFFLGAALFAVFGLVESFRRSRLPSETPRPR